MTTIRLQDRLDALLPQPRELRSESGSFAFTPATSVGFDPAAEAAASVLIEVLEPPLGYRFPMTRLTDARIQFRLDPSLADEAYRLIITRDRIELSASGHRGWVWGIQTLRQLLPASAFSISPAGGDWSVPCCAIEDAPAFRWRGMMLDCARHFMPIEFIFQWIDLLSLHKFNVFHWHLTDDQGWRLEIRKYPRLTEIGAWRKQTLVGHALPKRDYDTFDGTPHGGFYTQRQVREIVAYADARGVTVVPEIEMPGHAQAAIAAYPQLGCTDQPLDVWPVWGINSNIVNVEDATVQFFKDVLDEVIELFPSPHIHIGGDEVIKDQWRGHAGAQRKINTLGLRDEDELQGWFIRQIGEHLASRGRRMIGWEEILQDDLPSGAMVMSWQSEAAGIAAAAAGHDVIFCPCQQLYFDHYQSADRSTEPLAIGGCSTVRNVYDYQPGPAALDEVARSHVHGAQANLWTEYIASPRHAEYMAFPRACALAEVLWRDGPRDWEAFQHRLESHLHRLDARGTHVHHP